MHWLNAIALLAMLMSGLQIFNAHPALNWGRSSYYGREPIMAMQARQDANGTLTGVTTLFGHQFETTGVLGASMESGELTERGFPSWATLPGTQWLSAGRRWHLLFAWVLVLNGLCYVAYSAASRHLRRDLLPTSKDWRSVGRSILDHLRLRHPRGEAAKHYNVLQKVAYLTVTFVLFPMVILMGFALSPWLNSILPGWVDIVGGRQSARTLHFLAATMLLGFVLVHLFEVLISGVWNNLRSMITGRYRVPPEHESMGRNNAKP